MKKAGKGGPLNAWSVGGKKVFFSDRVGQGIS